MKYFVTEFQCYEDGTVGTLNYSFDDELSANHKYHEILMYATQSTVEAHGAVLFTSTGILIKGEGFDHYVEPEPELDIQPEPETEDDIDTVLRQAVTDGKITAEQYEEITGFPYDL